jgi:two-component system sensor histidine kinase CreC
VLPRLAGREVSDLRRAFEEMRTALEGKNYVESFTQTLAHEIKAPLSAIRGAAELLSEDMPAEQRERFLSNIRQEGTRIQQIVDNLLQLSALEVRRQLGRVEPVVLGGLAREVVDSWQVTAGKKQLRWELQLAAEARVSADRFLLRQALANLVQNAVEFSPAGGTVAIAVEVVGKGCVIRVVDQGPGIPDFALPRVFERFYSLPRPDSGAKSTGLGLTFVREVVHLHGGDVTVENRPEGGCLAVLSIPLHPPGPV